MTPKQLELLSSDVSMTLAPGVSFSARVVERNGVTGVELWIPLHQRRPGKALPSMGRASDSGAPARFFAAWRRGRAGVPFTCCLAADLYAAFRAWCTRAGIEPDTQTAFGTHVARELAALRAPPRRAMRVLGWGRAAIDQGAFDAEPQRQRGIVIFPTTTAPAQSVVNKQVQGFQRALHGLHLTSASKGRP